MPAARRTEMTIALIEPTALACKDAEKLDERIRGMVRATASNLDALTHLIGKAKAGAIHAELGFGSWTSYLADVLAPLCSTKDREQRREIVAVLHDAGMSVRAIAEATGTPKSTIADDVRQVSDVRTPDTGPETVTGLDGKRYRRGYRESTGTARRQCPSLDDLIQNLAKRVERIKKLANQESYVMKRENLEYLEDARDSIDLLISQIRG
jgi:transposase-like protein